MSKLAELDHARQCFDKQVFYLIDAKNALIDAKWLLLDGIDLSDPMAQKKLTDHYDNLIDKIDIEIRGAKARSNNAANKLAALKEILQ